MALSPPFTTGRPAVPLHALCGKFTVTIKDKYGVLACVVHGPTVKEAKDKADEVCAIMNNATAA